MGKEFVEHEPSVDEVGKFPSADDTRERIRLEQIKAGEEFRKANPTFAKKLMDLINGAIDCDEIYIKNNPPTMSQKSTRTCLAGLGYEVRASHPMVSNDYGPFYISWRKEPV